MSSLKVGLIDTSTILHNVGKVKDPAAKEIILSLARLLDAVITNQRAQAGISQGATKGVVDEDVLVPSIADLLGAKVIKEFNGRGIEDILSGNSEKRYVAFNHGNRRQ